MSQSSSYNEKQMQSTLSEHPEEQSKEETKYTTPNTQLHVLAMFMRFNNMWRCCESYMEPNLHS